MLIYAEFTREKAPSVFGRAIVFFQKFPASHARFRFLDSDGTWKLYHSIEEGVLVEPWTQGEEIIVASFPCPLTCTLDHFKGILYGSRGKPYSWFQCLLILLKLKFPSNGGAGSICSETQGVILRDYLPGFELIGPQDSYTPKGNYLALCDYFLARGLPYHRYPKVAPT